MANQTNKQRYHGKRWRIAYGSYDGIEEFAIQELNKNTQKFLPYIIEVSPADINKEYDKENLIIAGTRENNVLLEKLISGGYLTIPDKPEAYTITCMNSPWADNQRLLVIAGNNPSGVLYGVENLNAQILASKIAPEKSTPEKLRKAFDEMENFAVQEYPRIENRGIWTWGYVIYDYRRFLDNMARLRMNMLTIWNDCPPLNIHEVIDYAHTRGIKIILGFPWGWGMDLDISSPEHRQQIKETVLEDYERNYRGLGMDGIYFQTLTEHNDTMINENSVAKMVCEMGNDIGTSLLNSEPDLLIQFGVHATSIREQYTEFKALDHRISLVWEDAGVIPYYYNPVPDGDTSAAWNLFTIDETIKYSKNLTCLRDHSEFGMVAKGWPWIDWANEFEHHGPFLLGERDQAFIRERLRQRQPAWDKVNALWIRNYAHAVRFYRNILACSPSAMTVTGLIEDAMFEERIQISVALFAETIWNPERDTEDLLELAMEHIGLS